MPQPSTVPSLGRPAVVIAASPPCIMIRQRVVRTYRPWAEAICAAAPSTRALEPVWYAQEAFPAVGCERVAEDVELALVAFGVTSGDHVLECGARNGVRLAHAFDMLDFAELHPRLHKELGISGIGVVSREGEEPKIDTRSCCMWWSDKEPGAWATLRVLRTEWLAQTTFLYEIQPGQTLA